MTIIYVLVYTLLTSLHQLVNLNLVPETKLSSGKSTFTDAAKLLQPVTATQSSTFQGDGYDGVSTKIVTTNRRVPQLT